MEYKDYYKIMGLSRNATASDIKTAYRKLARKYHPDVSKEANAEAKFKEVGEAYEVLKDEQKRAAYDQLGANWQAGQDFRAPPGWDYANHAGAGAGRARAESDAGFGSASDFFESLFGGGLGGRHRREQSMPGEDLHGKIQITLEDAFNGVVRQMQIPITEYDQNGRPNTTTKTLNVKIPKGVKAGQQIRLSGQGGTGIGSGKKGDLYLEIDIAKHPLFEVMDKDIICHLPVTPWEAALGATVTVPTLAGKVELKIPASSQTGQKLRLKGRGMPGTTPGDQYAILKIVIEQPTTENAKALYEKMAQEMPFNPREKMGAYQ
ncbi:MAG: DnaJ C-terminal domain-containing protein [Gammaproteobacteria bacterium]|nr:DnaJ C-terminal domain-containing protein [Gammaproteobacteria bacterium]